MATESLVNVIILSLYLIVGCGGNALVFYIYRIRMKRTLDNRIYIPCLAIADMISAFLCSLFAIYALLLPGSYKNVPLCKISWYTITWSSFVAVSILAMIAGQRYMKICRPLARSFFTGREVRIVISFYIMAFIIDSPILVMAGISKYGHGNATNIHCDRVGENFKNGPNHNFAVAYTVIEMLSLPLILFCISYFYFKVNLTLYDRMRLKSKRNKSLAEVSVAQTDIGFTEQRTAYQIEEQNGKKKTRTSFIQNIGCVKEQDDSGIGASSSEMIGKVDCVSNNAPSGSRLGPVKQYHTQVIGQTNNVELEIKDETIDKVTNVDIERRTSNIVFTGSLRQSVNPRMIMTSSKTEPEKPSTTRLFFRQNRYTVLFISITIVFFVTYTPRAILLLLETIYEDFWMKFHGNLLQLLIFLNRFHIVNSVVNPLLYGVFDEKFKSEFLKIFRCSMACRKNNISPN